MLVWSHSQSEPVSKALCDPEIFLIRALITWGGVWGALHLKTGESLGGGGDA